MILCRFAATCLYGLILLAAGTSERAPDYTTAVAQRPATHRVIALAEPGQTIHQPFADAAIRWLRDTAAREGFAVDYIRTTDPIDQGYLAAHDLFIQVNEWYTCDRSPRSDVRVLATVDENSYQPARAVKMGDHPVALDEPSLQSPERVFSVRSQERAVRQSHVHAALPQCDPLGRGSLALARAR